MGFTLILMGKILSFYAQLLYASYFRNDYTRKMRVDCTRFSEMMVKYVSLFPASAVLLKTKVRIERLY